MQQKLDPNDVIMRLARGEAEETIRRETGMTKDNWRKYRQRYLQNVEGKKWRWRLAAWGLWSPEGEQVEWDEAEHRAEVDNAGHSLALSYVVTRPPGMHLVYGNPQFRRIYGYTPVMGSMWAAISDDENTGRIINIDSQWHKIALAKGILELASWLGPEELSRARDYIAPFEVAARRVMPAGRWDEFTPSILAIAAVYEKILRHWTDRMAPLSFDVRWNYREEWQLWHAIEAPKDRYTEREMEKLVAGMRKAGTLHNGRRS